MIKREFLGWDCPLLLRAADYLIDRFALGKVDSVGGSMRRFDLSSVVLAFPVHRAIPRFEEILAERVSKLADAGEIDPAWYPPEFITLGSLPEKFYEQIFPIANEETQLFAWMKAILNCQNSDPEKLQCLLPFPLGENDIENGLALGKTFAALHYELVSENIDFKDIASQCHVLGLSQEEIRWEALAELKEEYHKILDKLEIWDLQSARLFAVTKQELEEYRKIYSSLEKQNKQIFLVGLVDMNVLQKELIKKYSDFVTALIFAPEDKKSQFDEYGCLIPDEWLNEVIRIEDSQIEIVERSDFEADAVLRCLDGVRNVDSPDGKFAAGEISIVAANNETLPFFKRRFKEANIKLSHFRGMELKHTPVYRFLDLLSRFIESRSFADWAELARHPDMYDFLKRKFTDDVKHYKLLAALDKYCDKFIPDKIDGNWKMFNKNNTQTELDKVIAKTWNVVCELVGVDIFDTENINKLRKSPEVYLDKINVILSEFYLNNNRSVIKDSLEFIATMNRRINKIPKELLPEMTFFETINLLLSLLNPEFIAPYPDVNAIGLIGWLEAAMDDALFLIVSGMNDGFIPSFVIADSFLPDKIRVDLNILDNKRRYIRDLYAITVTIKTRRRGNVRLICSRFSVAGDPLVPGRLLFATDDNDPEERMKLAKRVKRFFGEVPKPPKVILAGSLDDKLAKKFMFRVPELPYREPIQKMKVTEFKDYVCCPYRYYLRHCLGLFPFDDSAEEIGPSGFGNLVHEVLCEFGKSETIRDSDNSEIIKSWLKNKLLEVAEKDFGKAPRAAVAIQFELAANRLEAFAKWQAEWRRDGNKILHVEFQLDKKECNETNFLDVDGEKMFLIGRIDRIDYNEKTGEYTIIDYKTANKEKSPEEVHKVKKDDQWLDFQLPLYHYILRRMDGFSATINLAYVNLPKDNTVGIKIAKWNEQDLSNAILQTKEIVRNIRANNFNITDPPPKYSEVYAPICMDNIPR
ncbi:MAG: PD-(D/E)XK nuclease family protein [Planctomycetaceae bacterium]|jgi:RecB family exonuclease|nr:PD-(D/E)XK nuclease family protein [Planctomycetaceae bacterium]